jgi:hypothetical protein
MNSYRARRGLALLGADLASDRGGNGQKLCPEFEFLVANSKPRRGPGSSTSALTES